jgi:iron complex outermembrane receptor protein
MRFPHNTSFKKKILPATISLALSALAVTPVMAQQSAPAAEPPIQKVEITGSNIKRSDKEGVDNVQVITAVQIQESGKTTVADFLRTISANFAAFNEVTTNSFSAGASGIALRGLSQKNTLVLLNGQRMTNYGFAQNLEDTYVDLNSIPTNAVERIDVLKGGEGSIYGSDAIAGVVNIILKKNFTGKEVDFQYGAASGNSLATWQSSITAGFGKLQDDGYSVVLAASVFHRDNLLGSQRGLTAPSDTSNRPGGQFGWNTTGYYLSNDDPTQPRVAFSTCGKNGYRGEVISAAKYPGDATGTVCAYNPSNETSLIPGTDRANIMLNGTLKISNATTAFGDVFLSAVRTKALSGGAATLSGTSQAYDPATGGVLLVPNTLPVGNPSNPGSTPADIHYSFQSVGNQYYQVNSYTTRLHGGLKGSLGHDWDWQAHVGYSQNNVGQTNYNAINVSALKSAIANGSYNFLNPSATPAGTNALRAQFEQASVAKLITLGAKASGPLFALPAGMVQAAVGYEFRRESEDNRPDELLQAGQILGYGSTTVNGSRHVNALFGELAIPVVKSLDATLALRQERYSDFGSNLSPKFALRWQPADILTLRGSYSKGFRAPSLPEISHSTSTYFTTVTDPLDPTHRPSETIAGVSSANPNLKAEKSATGGFGFILAPSRDWSVAVDYYHINVDNVVAAQTTAQGVVDNPAAYPGHLFRTAGGELNYVTIPYANLYRIYTAGVDLDARYVFRLENKAKFTLETNMTYVDKLEVNTKPGGKLQNFAGSDGWLWLSPVGGGGPVPHVRGSVSGTWENHDWVVRGTGNYTAGYKEMYCIVYEACAQGAGGDNANALASKIPSYTSFDLYTEYRGLKNWTLSASVSNLFNKTPPFDAGQNGPSALLYDLTGRFVNFRAAYKF